MNNIQLIHSVLLCYMNNTIVCSVLLYSMNNTAMYYCIVFIKYICNTIIILL